MDVIEDKLENHEIRVTSSEEALSNMNYLLSEKVIKDFKNHIIQ